MKIGLLIYGSLETLSGGYLYDRLLVEYLRSQGESVEIISLPWRNYAAHLADNLTFRLPRGLDVLVQDELNHPSLLAANAAPHPYPVVSLVHHLRSSERHPAWQNRLYRVVERRYLRSVDAFIYNSNTTRETVERLAAVTSPGLIANPPTDRFGAALSKETVLERAVQPGPLRLVFLGNLIPRKGLHTLLAALRDIPTACRLDVIGSPHSDPFYAHRMKRMAARLGLSARVTFHGAVDGQALAGWLKSAHALVVPSSYEGFGIVYLEGMTFGLPAIGTTAGAAGEIITDGQTGFLIRPRDVETLTLRLATLARDRALLKKLSLRALERYAQQPTWPQTAESIRQFLYSTLKAWPASPSAPA